MKINPDALAKLAALQAAQGVDRILGGQGKGGASPLTGRVTAPVPVGKAGAAAPVLPTTLPGSTTALTLSPTARQLNSTPPPATLQWAHDVVEALTGLKLPPPTPRVRWLGPTAAPASAQADPVRTTAPAATTPPATTPATAVPPLGTAGPAAAGGGSAAPLSPHALSTAAPPPYAPPADTALFTAQGTVYAEDGQSFEFNLQLFADRGAEGTDAAPVVSPVLARMLASHPPMPPLALRFAGAPDQLQSAVFEFQVEPSPGSGVGTGPVPTVGVRLLGLLVLDPPMDAVYTMHVGMAAPPDPATVLAAMGFVPGKPAVGKGVWDSAAGLLCDDSRCPHFGVTTCPQRHCLRYKPLSAGPGSRP